MADDKNLRVDYVKPQILDLGAFDSLVGAGGCTTGNAITSGACGPRGNQADFGCLQGYSVAGGCDEGSEYVPG